MYWKTFLIVLIASLVLAPPVLADDSCEQVGLFPGEEGLCRAYYSHLDCDKILDGDPMSAPQASETACANVAATFMSKYLDVKRSEVDPTDAMMAMDHHFCGSCACPIPPCDCGGGGGV